MAKIYFYKIFFLIIYRKNVSHWELGHVSVSQLPMRDVFGQKNCFFFNLKSQKRLPLGDGTRGTIPSPHGRRFWLFKLKKTIHIITIIYIKLLFFDLFNYIFRNWLLCLPLLNMDTCLCLIGNDMIHQN